MRLRSCLPVLAVALPLAGCGLDLFGARVATDRISVSSRDAGRAATLISEYRRSRGLGPVTADSRLNEAAAEQARAVAGAGNLSHGDFGGRMAAHGIGGVAAENLTAGSDDVGHAIARWKGSPPHDANLLLKEARRVGLARADTPGQGYRQYWALVLAQ